MEQACKINRKKPWFPGRVPALLGLLALFCFAESGPWLQALSAQEPAGSRKTRSAKKPKDKKPFLSLGSFKDKRITESSGVVTAQADPDGAASNAIWTLNDSGGAAMLFRVGFKGQTQATLILNGCKNRDWESMCRVVVDGKNHLAVGEVGDNLKKNLSCKIYVVPEPDVKPKFDSAGKLRVQEFESKFKTITFTYRDGPKNCEAMSYNTEDKSYWFVEKVYVDDSRKKPPGIYVLPDPLAAKSKPGEDKPGIVKPKNVAKRVASFSVRNVTGMAFSPDNQRLVIRNYFGAWLYEKADGKTWVETVNKTKAKVITLPLQSQGEAICFTADSKSLLLTSEFANAIIWQVRVENPKDKE